MYFLMPRLQIPRFKGGTGRARPAWPAGQNFRNLLDAVVHGLQRQQEKCSYGGHHFFPRYFPVFLAWFLWLRFMILVFGMQPIRRPWKGC